MKDMKKLFSMVFIFSTIFLSAKSDIDVDKLLQELNEIPIDKRYLKMNELKRKLKSYDSETRQRVLAKLKESSYSSNKTVDVDDLVLSEHEIDDHKVFDISSSNNIDHTR